MKITLLLTIRVNSNSDSSININALLKKIFSEEVESETVIFIDNHTIQFVVGKDLVLIKYSLVRSKKNYILNFETDRENASSIKTMELLHNRISIRLNSEGLNVIKAYDEPSQILGSRIYKSLTRFECLLRKLVYEIVVKTYGSDWFRETIEKFNHNKEFKNIYDDVSKRSRQDNVNKIEVALEEMDYESLSKYLFSRRSIKEYAEVLENDLSDDNLAKMSQDEIVSIIKASRPISLWELLFKYIYDFDDLEEDLKTIHIFRNKVMHTKSIKYDEYQKVKKLLNKWNPLIEKAIF